MFAFLMLLAAGCRSCPAWGKCQPLAGTYPSQPGVEEGAQRLLHLSPLYQASRWVPREGGTCNSCSLLLGSLFNWARGRLLKGGGRA